MVRSIALFQKVLVDRSSTGCNEVGYSVTCHEILSRHLMTAKAKNEW